MLNLGKRTRTERTVSTNRHAKSIATLLFVFLVALIPRFAGLEPFITWDEPQWTFRAAQFLHALESGNLSGTFLIGAPGVIIMWCGAAGMVALRHFAPATGPAWAQIVSQPSLGLHDLATLRALTPFLVAAKIPLFTLTSLGVAGIYLLTARLLENRATALFAALLLALDPFFLAHSRVFHTDAAATVFVLLSLLILLQECKQCHSSSQFDEGAPSAVLRFPLFLSGIFAGLALLTKSSTLSFLGIGGLFLAVPAIWPWQGMEHALRRGSRSVGQGLVWGMGAALAFVVLWPAMWVHPLGTLNQMFGLARKFAATPHAQNYFLGHAIRNPGPLFYIVSLAFRTTPITWLGVLAALILVARKSHRRPVVLALLAFALLYAIPLTISAKKFERYALPIYPALDIVAAIGLCAFIHWLAGYLQARFPRWPDSRWAIATLILFPLLLTGWMYSPYYLTWGNPLLGGPVRAAEVLPTGWGEGMDQAARYLNNLPHAGNLRVAVWGVPGFGPLFRGQSQVMSEKSLTLADYAIVYIGDVQFHSPFTDLFYPHQTAVFTTTIQGVPYAWVYVNNTYRPTLEAIRQHTAPDEMILFDVPSRSARTLRAERNTHILSPASPIARLAGELNRTVQPDDRVAYVQYHAASKADNPLKQLLDVNGLRVGHDEIPRATIWHYQIADTFAPLTAGDPVDVDFGGQFRLMAAGLSAQTLEDRRALGVTLQWKPLTQPETSYHLFIHLLDATGYRWGQWDEPLLAADNQTATPLQAGQPFSRTYLIRPLSGIAPGTYHLDIGLYDWKTGRRLPVERQGHSSGTTYHLGPIAGLAPRLPRTGREITPTHPTSWVQPGLRLLGYDADCDGVSSPLCRVPEIRPGDSLRLTLFWQATLRVRPDYDLQVGLVRQGEHVAERSYAFARNHPTGQWLSGEVLRQPVAFHLPATLAGGTYRLTLSLRDTAGKATAPYPLLTVPVQVVEHVYTLPSPQYPVTARLGETATLLGYDVQQKDVAPGSMVITLYWQAGNPQERSYTLFVHLTGAGGHILGQDDRMPGGGDRPTTGWVPKEIITDQHELTMPAGMPSGPSFLRVGLYSSDSGQRLPAYDAQGRRLPNDEIVLQMPVGLKGER